MEIYQKHIFIVSYTRKSYHIWIIDLLGLLAYHHKSIPYVHIGITMGLFNTTILLIIAKLDFQPSIQLFDGYIYLLFLWLYVVFMLTYASKFLNIRLELSKVNNTIYIHIRREYFGNCLCYISLLIHTFLNVNMVFLNLF